MKLDEIRTARDATPFRPFTLILSDGRQFFIRAQAYLGITPKGVLLAVSPEQTAWLSPEQVRELQISHAVRS